MNESHSPRRRHDWIRIGGPLASLALHLIVVWVLIQRVGPVAAMVPDPIQVAIGDLVEPAFDDPPKDPPPDELPPIDSDLPRTPDGGASFAEPAESPELKTAGAGVDEPAGIDLAPAPLSPLTVRGLDEGGGGGPASFGYQGGMAGDLVGTMYDLKRNARGEARTPSYLADVRQALAGHLAPAAFGDFYRVTNQLFMTHLFVPVMPAEQGPAAFAAGDQVKPQNWLVHYRGAIRPPQAGRYRFVGMFDDLLMVLVDGKIVMEFLWTGDPTPWAPSEFADQHPCYAGRPLVYGDWIELDARKPHRIDILVGEHPGGLVGGVLMIQEKGHTYALTPEGRPILPVFTVQRPTVEERVRLVRFDKWAFDPEMPVFNQRPEPMLTERADDPLTIEII